MIQVLASSYFELYPGDFIVFGILGAIVWMKQAKEEEEEGSEGPEGSEGQQDFVETRRTNEMDKKAGGEADPEAIRLHIINSCLFALDPSPFCTS